MPITTTPRTALARHPERGSFDDAAIHAILDEALVCHLGFAGQDGQPYVIPTAYARVSDTLYVHGAVANRGLRALRAGAPACVCVTLLDGLVLARSAFRHSMNYRSVILFGVAREITAESEKRAALAALLDHSVPGRSGNARPPSDEELRATIVLAFPIAEASAKVRRGQPIDRENDVGLPIWAGEIPLHLTAGPPVADPHLAPELAPPAMAPHLSPVDLD